MNRDKYFFFFIFCFGLSITAHSQVDASKEEQKSKKDNSAKSENIQLGNSLDLYYGYKFFQDNFSNKFNTTENFNWNSPVQIIGFGETGPVTINRSSRTCYAQLLYSQVVPQPIWLNDTIKCKTTGGILNFGIGGYVHSKSRNFYFNFYGGFNTGRLRFYQNEIVRQKNPFFSPKVGIQPKLQIRKFVISLIVEAEYDISKLNWRKTIRANDTKITIDRFKQTGYTVLLGVSYKFIKYVSDNEDHASYTD